MKAVVVRSPGGPEQLEIDDVEKPEPGPGDLLVRVRATALNRADLLQREGKYPPPAGESPIMGLEMAGTIEALGEGTGRLSVGDRVFGLLPGGGYAEYVVIPEGLAMAMPPGMSFEDAAAIPEVFLTAYQALYWLGRMERDDTVLIHAGGSGVGTAAIQLARNAGARVIVTASAVKHDVCLSLGADVAIDYKTEDFAERIADETEGRGADVIVDFIGAPYFERNVRSLAPDGRMIMLAMMGGARIDSLNLRDVFKRRATIIASTLRNRDLDYKRELTADFAAYALPLFLDGTLRPVADRIYEWTDVRAAHERMEANANAGKIVLRIT